MSNQTMIIIGREYKERVRRKSFIITTILMPFLFIGLMALPTLMSALAGPEDKKIAVVDETCYISKVLLGNEAVVFEVTDEPIDSLKQREDLDAVLVIGSDVVENPSDVTLYTLASPSPHTEMYISGLLKTAIEEKRLSNYNIEGLDRIINDIQADVKIRTLRIDSEGERDASSMASYIIGLILALLLYMFIMMYGQMVMTSIIEEKGNRVLEIVVSSVKPANLMLGKLIGIGAVAVTQILIWAAIIAIFSFGVMPGLLAGALAGQPDVELAQLLGVVGDSGFIMGLFALLTVFLILGYLFYSAIYAAIGSAVDNIQDAGQLQVFALMPIILGMVFSMNVVNDPGSNLAVLLSFIPFTSPMVMMARIPFGVPAWQLWVSVAILVVSILFIVWLAAKIYRVGIFMYGKKPSVRDLIRWARYK